ncbi:MAG: peptide chain release factor 2 [Chloroflexota bacterium]
MEAGREQLAILQQKIAKIMEHLDLLAREKKVAQLEAESAKPDFWQDPGHAQEVMRQLGLEKETAATWRKMEREAAETLSLLELAAGEKDASLEDELQAEIERIARQVNRREMELTLGGENDSHDALVGIHASSGGTEAQDWADMLLRMYLRWAERRKYGAEILDLIPGDEAGIKSALVEVRGKYAYGYLRPEHGVHRLVRLSPFDADHARHTSFALVEVLPEVEPTAVEVRPEDLKIETFRSSGPGGQHMQKSSTAIRITHVPTGITVGCQSERSQHQNKESALKVLYARLSERERANDEQEEARVKGKHANVAWGSQIRSYVLHPYKLVKDHRTGYEKTDAAAVLDGELDEFISVYLSSMIEGKREEAVS